MQWREFDAGMVLSTPVGMCLVSRDGESFEMTFAGIRQPLSARTPRAAMEEAQETLVGLFEIGAKQIREMQP